MDYNGSGGKMAARNCFGGYLFSICSGEWHDADAMALRLASSLTELTRKKAEMHRRGSF